ncbi:MAG: SOS response-associated peptidase [Acidimicrobiales bacterium]|nr:SOS response-associated peptidase [Acidimicrobiales bacterium]RZV46210.1 MAG: SOS response-associated peptidase [Acidimicrobiales bacterium]
MCGRFATTTPPDKLAAYFGAEAPVEAEDVQPDYNVAPTRDVPVVRVRNDERSLDYLRWGLVPRWAKDLRIGSKMINARSETVATKNSFRSAFAKRRCIVAADGFYEWKRIDEKTKQPMFIYRADGDPLAFAGLFERWRDAEEREYHTCTILTCGPNGDMEPIHNRMPVLLAPQNWEEWLDPFNGETESLQQLLVPAPEGLLRSHKVSTDVNSVKNNSSSLLTAIT